MGGDLEARSTLGDGSTFSLLLPAATLPEIDDQRMSTGAETRSAVISNTQHTVLVIEDNPSNLALIQALVARRPKWRLVSAMDAREGIAKAHQFRPELVLLDLNLPGLSGEAVLAELRVEAELSCQRIVIVSADAQPDTITRLRAAGADDYLTKPLAVPRVLALLDQTPS